jgi:hypothetical protein
VHDDDTPSEGDPMGPDDEPVTGPEEPLAQQAGQPEHHHMKISEIEPLGALPEEEEPEDEDGGPEFEPGPIFGEGM